VKLILRLRDSVGKRDDPRPILVRLRRHNVTRSVTDCDAQDLGEEVDGRAPEQVGHEEEFSFDWRLPCSVDGVLQPVGRV